MAAESSLVERPIILDRDSLLLDGRNRLAACQLAGVEPRFETLDGQDPVAYILSSNIARRHLSKGQQAMAVAEVRLLSKQSVREAARLIGASAARVAQADVVLGYAPEFSEAVLSGAMPLNDAYEQARARKGAASSMEAQMAGLLIERPRGTSSLRGPVLPGRFESAPAGRPHTSKRKGAREYA